MSEHTVIYEPIFGSRGENVEPGFTPLPFQNLRPEWRELQLLVDLYRRGEHRKHARLGLFSPKFGLKVRRSGLDFLAFVKANDKADVIFINPFPQIAYWSYNVWDQGEYAHPGIVRSAQTLLRASGSTLDVAARFRNNAHTLAYCNFWVGNEEFWDRYVGGVLEPIARFLENQSQHPAAKQAMVHTRHTDEAPYLPFIVERLFSTFLAVERGISFHAFDGGSEWVEDSCINSFERLLFQRMRKDVDAADLVGRFTPELVATMDLVCSLWQQQFSDYFAVRPHPHTGRPMR